MMCIFPVHFHSNDKQDLIWRWECMVSFLLMYTNGTRMYNIILQPAVSFSVFFQLYPFRSSLVHLSALSYLVVWVIPCFRYPFTSVIFHLCLWKRAQKSMAWGHIPSWWVSAILYAAVSQSVKFTELYMPAGVVVCMKWAQAVKMLLWLKHGKLLLVFTIFIIHFSLKYESTPFLKYRYVNKKYTRGIFIKMLTGVRNTSDFFFCVFYIFQVFYKWNVLSL